MLCHINYHCKPPPSLSSGLPLWLSWWRIHLQCGRPGFSPWFGKIPGERKGYPFQYSGLENSMDCIVQGVTKSQARLNDSHFHPIPQHTHPTPSFSPFSFVLGHCGLWRRQDTKCSPASSEVPGVGWRGILGWLRPSQFPLSHFFCCLGGEGECILGWLRPSPSCCSFVLFLLLPKPLPSVECQSRHLALRLKGLLTFLVRHPEEGFIAGSVFHIPVCMRTFEVVFSCQKAMVDCGRCQVYFPFYCSLLFFIC